MSGHIPRNAKEAADLVEQSMMIRRGEEGKLDNTMQAGDVGQQLKMLVSMVGRMAVVTIITPADASGTSLTKRTD